MLDRRTFLAHAGAGTAAVLAPRGLPLEYLHAAPHQRGTSTGGHAHRTTQART